jgi:xylulokinase
VPIERTVVEEGSAFGAALLGGVGGGVFEDVHEAVSTAVRPRDVVEPDSSWQETYAELRARFRALYPALRELDGVRVAP